MGIFLDHTIIYVKDIEESIIFYRDIMGFEHREGQHETFEVMRINHDLVFDLVAADTVAWRHFAFCMDQSIFDAIWGRIKQAGVVYGDSFRRMDNMQGPGQEPGSRGMADCIYFYDPSGHILEIRHYPGEE